MASTAGQAANETRRRRRRLGVLLVGLGGNNGSTFAATVRAHQLEDIKWQTKESVREYHDGLCPSPWRVPDWLGSVTQAGCLPGGLPFKERVPLLDPEDLVVGGWDLSGASLKTAMARSGVLPIGLQNALIEADPEYFEQVPMPGLDYPSYTATNQASRTDNVHVDEDSKAGDVARIMDDIGAFKTAHDVEDVVVVWTASTEALAPDPAFMESTSSSPAQWVADAPGLNVSGLEDDLRTSCGHNEEPDYLSPSVIYAIAAIRSGCAFLNGSPQNTLNPVVVALAQKHGVFIGGNDFKSGQTKLKAALVDFFLSAGMRLECVASYNHLGNNDGRNLDEEAQFQSKAKSKSGLVPAMVANNPCVYAGHDANTSRTQPDQTVVIEYLPHVGDSKRALDEYTASILGGGRLTLALHTVCEDSLLAVPLMLDMVLLAEAASRWNLSQSHEGQGLAPYVTDGVLLSPLLDYFFKDPQAGQAGAVAVDHALFAQRQTLDAFGQDFARSSSSSSSVANA